MEDSVLNLAPVVAPKARPLLVDDHPGNLLALEAILQGPEYELVQVQSGHQAIAQAQQYADWAVILLDVHMPDLDGFQTATQIKQIEHCREIPIIFISAVYTENSFLKKGYEVGAVDYFGKPFDPDILKLKVRLYASYRQKNLLLKKEAQRIQKSNELIKAGRKLLNILEVIPVGVIITDQSDNISQTSEEALRVLGLPDDTSGETKRSLLGWWDREGKVILRRAEEFTLTAANGENFPGKPLEMSSFDGKMKTLLWTISPLRVDGRISGNLIILHDITEQKRLGENLEECMKKLQTFHPAHEA